MILPRKSVQNLGVLLLEDFVVGTDCHGGKVDIPNRIICALNTCYSRLISILDVNGHDEGDTQAKHEHDQKNPYQPKNDLMYLNGEWRNISYFSIEGLPASAM